MFGIGEGELLIIVAFGFMIFGPDKLPGMGRTIGRALRQFRQAQEGFTEVVQAEVMDPLQEAMGDPLETGTRKDRRATAEQRAAALAQDADRDDVPEQAPARKETFAERKARLAAERKAQQEAAAEAAQSDVAADEAADVVAAEGTQVEAVAPEPVPVEPTPIDTSAAALYAMGGRSSFAAAKQKAAEEAAAAKAAAAEQEEVQDAESDVAVSTPDDADATTDGKEERDA